MGTALVQVPISMTKTVKTPSSYVLSHYSRSDRSSRNLQRGPGNDSGLPDVMVMSWYIQPWTWLTQVIQRGHQEGVHELQSPQTLAQNQSCCCGKSLMSHWDPAPTYNIAQGTSELHVQFGPFQHSATCNTVCVTEYSKPHPPLRRHRNRLHHRPASSLARRRLSSQG